MNNVVSIIENKINFSLPKKYIKFLEGLSEDQYNLIYPLNYILERNTTYEVFIYEPEALLIGQDGDLGFFIKKDQSEKIFSLDLGALGSMDMDYEAENIEKFLDSYD